MRKRDLMLIATALCVALMLAGHLLMSNVLASGAWGLSFRQEGAPPIGPATARELARLDGVYLGDTNKKVLYLTFDAGYENGCTAQILDILKARGVPGVFFLTGNYLETNPDLVRRMVDEGHTVGNHTMHHPDMSKITEEGTFRKELEDLEGLYREITGNDMEKIYRPPRGVYSKENLEMAQKLGYRTVFWSLAYVDWKDDAQPTAEYAFSKLLPRTHNGAVILLHSTSRTNAQILDELITKWTQMGYTFGKVQDLFSGEI